MDVSINAGWSSGAQPRGAAPTLRSVPGPPRPGALRSPRAAPPLTQILISHPSADSQGAFPLPSFHLLMFTHTSLCGNYTLSVKM